MTLDEVRALVREIAKPYAVYKGTTGVRSWCAAHRISHPHVTEFLKGRRLPPTDMLDVLGLEWTIMPKRKQKQKS